MRRSSAVAAVMLFAALSAGGGQTPKVSREGNLAIRNAAGLQLLVATENTDPTLRITLPGGAASFPVLFPEHVTSVKHGSNDGDRLYMFSAGARGQRPQWRRVGSSLEYERDFRGDIHDERLERTYVHHTNGFDLLASETPDRLTMPLDRWLPARYLAQLTAPIPAERVQHRDDGITYYYKSRPVDQPFIATRSTDGKWIVASFARVAGNVWSNPELTCQHVDGTLPLAPRQTATQEVKLLVMRGSLDDALRRAIQQRPSLH